MISKIIILNHLDFGDQTGRPVPPLGSIDSMNPSMNEELLEIDDSSIAHDTAGQIDVTLTPPDMAVRDSEQESESENSDENEAPSQRFNSKDKVVGRNITHYEMIIREMEFYVITHQVKLKDIKWSRAARMIIKNYPTSFPSTITVAGHKPIKSIGRIVKNTLNR